MIVKALREIWGLFDINTYMSPTELSIREINKLINIGGEIIIEATHIRILPDDHTTVGELKDAVESLRKKFRWVRIDARPISILVRVPG